MGLTSLTLKSSVNLLLNLYRLKIRRKAENFALCLVNLDVVALSITLMVAARARSELSQSTENN